MRLRFRDHGPGAFPIRAAGALPDHGRQALFRITARLRLREQRLRFPGQGAALPITALRVSRSGCPLTRSTAPGVSGHASFLAVCRTALSAAPRSGLTLPPHRDDNAIAP
jgi:hypothetical protein